ncbi:MAG: P1 family peptidase, partial [candidate division KSB1 bacterium]|nr:P1 family peptidase [candidate division KSB1 bacterium]
MAQTKSELEKRPRAREVGLEIGILKPGKWNAITDVEGVKVGQVTVCQGTDVRTGVTAILPHGGNIFQEKVPAAIYVGNGFGKLIGSTQVEELGNIETPIVLTNTLNVPLVADAVIEYVLNLPGNEKVRSAMWLIKSIHQRQRTIYKVAKSIVKFQRDFLDRGIEYLRPLVLRDVAEDIGMHVSTISRVTTNKYMQTPQGLFEMKYFFNSGISTGEG